MKDLTDPFWIKFKGVLFVLVGTAAAVILLLTVPWYAATYRMAASGWNYSWGSFTLIAVPYFVLGLAGQFGERPP